MHLVESSISWSDTYASAVARLPELVRTAPPVLGASSANVDHIYYVDSERFAALVSLGTAPTKSPASVRAVPLVAQVLDRIEHGRGGFIIDAWPDGPAWFADLLGQPDRRQAGGAMPQAAWALSAIGAQSVMALSDRSSEQLSVLDRRIGLAVGGHVMPVGEIVPEDTASKPPHIVLEFMKGAHAHGFTVTRATRLILIFGEFGIEADTQFADVVLVGASTGAKVALISGLAFISDGDHTNLQWLQGLTHGMREVGLPVVHHELTEFASRARLDRALEHTTASSLGVSLSELRAIPHSSPDVRQIAREFADHAHVDRVIVHADDWSMSVHRSDPRLEAASLVTGNLLAAARARAGEPTADLVPHVDAIFSHNHPDSGPLDDGWHATVIPSPYLQNPVATIGLGDTFTAGLLLADSARY